MAVSVRSLLLAAFALGCSGGSVASPPSGVWTLAVGQAIGLPEGGSVILDKVDDSRCPIGVVCVWEGDATAHLTFRGGRSPDESIALSLRARRAGAARGLELRLADVLPAPRVDTPVDPAAYRATVEWRRP